MQVTILVFLMSCPIALHLRSTQHKVHELPGIARHGRLVSREAEGNFEPLLEFYVHALLRPGSLSGRARLKLHF